MTFFRAVFAALALVFALGCSAKIDCDDLGAKLNRCKSEVYTQMSSPPTKILDELLSDKESTPKQNKWRNHWKAKRKKLAQHLADDIIGKCTKNEGRFLVSEKINECLKKKDCKKFAKCLSKAIRKK